MDLTNNMIAAPTVCCAMHHAKSQFGAGEELFVEINK